MTFDVSGSLAYLMIQGYIAYTWGVYRIRPTVTDVYGNSYECTELDYESGVPNYWI